MQNLVEASAGEAWSFGGSIITFLVPMIVFVLVAAALFIIYTKPELVPGRQADEGAFPVGATRLPGKPSEGPDGARAPENGPGTG
ncbi:MAG: hypothetical protein J2P25_18140 [Nocardiopsaceae bacterium]|nr:hypothetical protein [Nocardiopsaceae bacterium]